MLQLQIIIGMGPGFHLDNFMGRQKLYFVSVARHFAKLHLTENCIQNFTANEIQIFTEAMLCMLVQQLLTTAESDINSYCHVSKEQCCWCSTLTLKGISCTQR